MLLACGNGLFLGPNPTQLSKDARAQELKRLVTRVQNLTPKELPLLFCTPVSLSVRWLVASLTRSKAEGTIRQSLPLSPSPLTRPISHAA